MRVLKRILSWTIWSLVAFHIGMLLLIQLPPVQRWTGDKVADTLSDKLNTKVSVGHVDLGFFNRLTIDDVLILDQSGEQLLQVGRLSVKMELLPLLEGRIAISSAQLFGAHVRLYKADEEAVPNYQFVVDALSSDNDSTSNSSIDLRINSFILRNSSISYDRGDAFTTPGKLNVNHLNISDISAHVLLKTLTPDSLNVNLKRLAFSEQSGLKVDRLSAHFEANGSKAMLRDVVLQMARSQIDIDFIQAFYDRDQMEETLRHGGIINSSTIVPADLSPLMPALDELQTAFYFDGAFSGTAKSVDWKQLNLSAEDESIILNAMGDVDMSQGKTAWHTRIEDFYISNTLIQQLRNIFPSIPAETARLGNVSMRGEAYRLADGNMEAATIINTDLGLASVMIEMDEGNRIAGRIDTDSLHLGRLLDNDKLGFIATHIDLNGNRDSIGANGRVEQLSYNGYTYRNINIDGFYAPKTKAVAGHIDIDDPCLTANVDGEYGDEIRLTGYIERLMPEALKLTDRWPGTAFAAVIDADFTATSLNDAQGSIDLDDFVMKTAEGDSVIYRLDNLHLKSGYDEGRHFLRIVGDMGEAELSGQFDWATLPQSFIAYTASKLPTLPGLPPTAQFPGSSNNFTASLKLDDTKWIQALLDIPMSLSAPLLLTATVDDNTHHIDVNGNLPSFTYADSRYRGLRLNLDTEGDTARCDATLTKLNDDGGKLSIKLNSIAANNNLSTSLDWNNVPSTGDSLMAMHGMINAVTQLYTNSHGKAEAHIKVQPSLLMLRGTPWQLQPCDITFTDKKLAVDKLTMAHGRQHLIIDGTASAKAADSLTVDMTELEVGYILDLVNFHSVEFSGLATGRAYATSLFDDFSARADLRVDEFKFQNGQMGTLHAKANWNEVAKQIDIDATAYDGPGSTTYIKGHVSPVHSDILLDIKADGTSIDFCNSFTDSFLKDLSGQAHGNLRVAGPLKHINLTGAAAINGKTTVTALGTTYELRGDSVVMVPNDITFNRFKVYDHNGHLGELTGGVHHNELKDFTFDMDITADNLLAYNFEDFDGSSICGTVYANGTADLHGRPGEVIINCNVAPQPGSTFAYNAANPDAISKQDFITWGEKTLQNQTHPHPLLIGGGVDTFFADNTADKSIYSPPSEGGGGGGSAGSAGSTDIHINFLINATPESTLKVLMDQQTGDYITLNGSGTLRASFYNKGPFHMFGTYNVDHGTYGITIQNIIKKNFTFQPGGTIVFGGDPFNANLNLQALYTVNGVSLSDLNIGNSFANNTVRVNCLMNILGTPGQPRVEFDLDMPTVNSEENQMIRSVIASEQEMNQQVLYLLGIGRFYTQGVNNAGMQQYDQTTLAMQSFLSGTVSTQINEVLSQIIKSNDWNFGANISTGNEGWHNAEYEGLVSGRMLNNRLLINGQFGYRDNATQATPSFIGDFDIRYLLNANGNLAVKVYNQSNDRYFTRSSLNTQGVGLIMKKDFDGISELFFHRKKKPTSTPKKTE